MPLSRRAAAASLSVAWAGAPYIGVEDLRVGQRRCVTCSHRHGLCSAVMYNYRPRDGRPQPYLSRSSGMRTPEWGGRSLDLDVRLTPIQSYVGTCHS